MYAINHVTSTPVLRPLLTLDKEDIIKKARDIGTYETSIQPFEDCCTIFTPKNPVTEPDFDKVEKYEGYSILMIWFKQQWIILKR